MTPLSKGPAFIVYDKDPDRPVRVEIAALTSRARSPGLIRARTKDSTRYDWYVSDGRAVDYPREGRRMVMVCDLAEYQEKIRAENGRRADLAQRADVLGQKVAALQKILYQAARVAQTGDEAAFRVEIEGLRKAVDKTLGEIKVETWPKVENAGSSFECPVKRFEIPVKVSDKCPGCGAIVVRNLDGDVSYPRLNDVNEISFEHYPDEDDDEAKPCGAHWTVTVRLTLAATLEPFNG